MKQKLKNILNNKLLIIKILVIGIVISLGIASFAWFLATVTGNDTAKGTTVTTGTLSITYNGTANIKGIKIMPGWSQTKTFSVENTGDNPVTYDINLTNITNTFYNTKDLTYTLTSTNNGGTQTELSVPVGGIHSPLIQNITIPEGTTQTYTLTVSYVYQNVDQNDDQDKKIIGKIEVLDSKELYKDTILNGADPILDEGMVPIYFDGNTPKTADIKTQWYDYTNKKWANAVLVKTSGTKTREYYQTTPNTEVAEEDIYAYFVWIPRYKYTLFNVAGASINPVTIPITFESRNTAKSTGTTNGTDLTHPGFTFSGELNGFWFGKFETTGTGAAPTIKPNVSSLRSQNVSKCFETF